MVFYDNRSDDRRYKTFYGVFYVFCDDNFISNNQFWCYKTHSLLKNRTKGASTLGVKDSSIKCPNTKLGI